MPEIPILPVGSVDRSQTSGKFDNYLCANAPDFVALKKEVCREIRAKQAGVVVVISEEGVTVPVDFAAGEAQGIRCKSVVAAGSTVTDIFVKW
ncbi:MAG: hypothetical protein JWM74_1798 [Myxococcaceae bacterium]|nr:hypothetical protein [Myxococcaceae bacterium]